MEDKIKIARGYNFIEECPICSKKMKCKLLSFLTEYSIRGKIHHYRFECTEGHVFEKEHGRK